MNNLIQPYFVMSAAKYYKTVVNNLGISHFYTIPEKAINDKTMMAVPDGCIDILFNCDPNRPFAEVCGSVLEPTKVLTGESARYFGVRFYPGSGYDFKHVKMDEIINNKLPLKDLVNASEMFEKIVTETDFSKQILLFADHYKDFLNKSSLANSPDALKQYMLDRILLTKGQIRIGELSTETGYSERYINRKFHEFFGMRPKVFCKIIRFQHVLNQLKLFESASDSNFIKIANDAGYYDQAHMYKDFHQFAAHSPGQYLKLLHDSQYASRLILVEGVNKF